MRAKRPTILSGCWTSPTMIVMSVYKEIYFSEQEAGGTFSGSVVFSRRTGALTYK
ncbi:MAG: hypothetical protein GY699_15225 [Desulfobacteraceae bacterium]|nr:hypothetical protein [Desulfobacteraceae bacterium]